MKNLGVNLKTHPLTGISLIEASAGTGKTFTITHLYVRCLLETEIEVNQLLIVTFTNAATQELKGRIRSLIYQVWCYLNDDGINNPAFDELFISYRLNQQALFKLQKALVNFDEASIYSIHGFCQRLLNIFPVETYSLLQQQLIPDEREIESAAIKDYWRRQIINTELEQLSWIFSFWNHPDQLLHDVRPLLGFEQSVDTATKQINTESLLTQLEPVWKKLCLDWHDYAVEIEAFLKDSPVLKRNLVRKATVNKLLIEIEGLFTESIPYGLPDRWDLLTANKLTQCLKKGEQDERLNHPFFETSEHFYRLHSNWLKQLKVSIVIDATQSVRVSVLESKQKAQNVSFNDLIQQISQVLTNENEWLVEKINTLYPIAMVDEFQDTDNKQYHIFKTLYKTDKTLILIGDPKQAIYSFRGADVFTYQRAKKLTSKQYTLETNYRSSADYIDVVNVLFSQNQNAFIFEQLIAFNHSKANTDNIKTLTVKDKPEASLVSWLHPFTEKPISKGRASDYFAQVCANEIVQILNQKEMKLDGETVKARDMTILVKTGRQASLMKTKLAEQGVGSALILRDSVFASDQAREISLLLEVLIEPSNISRLCGLLSTDLFCWNATEIYQLQQNNYRLVELLEQMKSYQQHWQQKGILSMFFKLIAEHESLHKNIHQMSGERRLTNWLHIIELLQYQSSQHASHGQVLHWLQQQREQAIKNNENEEHQLRLESDSDLVSIVTIHKSKGLEYPIVFLPFMWDIKSSRNQPNSYSYHDDDGHREVMILDEQQRDRWHLENQAEEIRLFYVAMTRAKYRCYLGWGNISGAGSSAIAHCLYPDQIKKGNVPKNLDIKNEAELRLPFESMNSDQHRVDIIEPIEMPEKSIIQKAGTFQQEPVKSLSRQLQQQWRISSYSWIASTGFDEEVDRPDYDAISIDKIEQEEQDLIDELNRFTFQKGAKAGNFLHELLEFQAFDQPVDENLVRQKCLEYGFDEEWLPCLMEWVNDILHCNLGPLSLSQLKPLQKLSEMEFYMSSEQLQAEALNQLLQQNDYSRPEQFFSFSDVSGYLKGFIDLVFEHEGAFFIADYKSNYLGASRALYQSDHCKEAMYDHHYHLQSLIYSLALHRYLQQRINDYDYERHFGGVYYLFIRGMSVLDNQQQGVHFHKPEFQVIQQLDQLFSKK